MEFYRPAFPKPGSANKYVGTVRTYRDGREVITTSTRAGRELYRLRLRIMWERQGRMCGLQISKSCPIKLPLRRAQFDHSNGRGRGGQQRRSGQKGRQDSHQRQPRELCGVRVLQCGKRKPTVECIGLIPERTFCKAC
jgi:hypothetical protein